MFSVNALVYGDYTELACRCLSSIVDTVDRQFVDEIRVGLNAASETTRINVKAILERSPVNVLVYEPAGGENVMKYPLMRRMFYDRARPIASKYLMWFDDDSYVTGGRSFWGNAAVMVSRRDPFAAGHLYYPRYGWNDHERAAIMCQSWYNSKPWRLGRIKFPTGGWWIGNADFFRRVDYPPRELKHNGGDVLLGEIVYQQHDRLVDWHEGVVINAELGSTVDSSAKRRGVTTKRAYELPPPYDYAHHDFEVHVYTGKPKQEE